MRLYWLNALSGSSAESPATVPASEDIAATGYQATAVNIYSGELSLWGSFELPNLSGDPGDIRTNFV